MVKNNFMSARPVLSANKFQAASTLSNAPFRVVGNQLKLFQVREFFWSPLRVLFRNTNSKSLLATTADKIKKIWLSVLDRVTNFCFSETHRATRRYILLVGMCVVSLAAINAYKHQPDLGTIRIVPKSDSLWGVALSRGEWYIGEMLVFLFVILCIIFKRFRFSNTLWLVFVVLSVCFFWYWNLQVGQIIQNRSEYTGVDPTNHYTKQIGEIFFNTFEAILTDEEKRVVCKNFCIRALGFALDLDWDFLGKYIADRTHLAFSAQDIETMIRHNAAIGKDILDQRTKEATLDKDMLANLDQESYTRKIVVIALKVAGWGVLSVAFFGGLVFLPVLISRLFPPVPGPGGYPTDPGVAPVSDDELINLLLSL